MNNSSNEEIKKAYLDKPWLKLYPPKLSAEMDLPEVSIPQTLDEIGKKWKENKIRAIGILFSLHIFFLLILIIEMSLLFLNFEDPVSFYLQEGNFIVSLFPFFGGISAGFNLIYNRNYFRK